MAKSLFIETDRKEIIERIKALQPNAQRRWGKMNLHQMLKHLTFPMKGAMGLHTAASKGRVLMQKTFMQNLFIYVLPWPKGKAPTAPEYDMVLLQDAGPGFESGVTELLATIEKFSGLQEDYRFSDHPTFGKLTRKQWGALQHRHIDHHLKQFGA